MTYAAEQAEMPDALEDSEIARLMKLVSETGYKKSEDAPTLKKQAFTPRSLVEIAMESQKNKEKNESSTNIETNLEKNMNHKADGNAQDMETMGDTTNADSPNDLAPFNQSDKDNISIENSELPITSEKQQDSTEASAEGDVLQPSTLSKDNQDDENANPEITHTDENGFVNQASTETESSKAVENSSVHYDEGFSAGLETGRNEIKETLEQKFTEQQNTFDRLITTLTKMSSIETKELEADIQATILSLASERAGIAIFEMPENFINRIGQLMSRLGSSVESPIIKLNMADLKHIEAAKENSDTLSNIKFIEDETLNHGDISISLGGIEIEDILKNRTFTSPLDTDLKTDLEQSFSELNADILGPLESLHNNTSESQISDDIVENTTDQQEAYKTLKNEIRDEEQNIVDKKQDIDTSDEQT